MTCHAWIVGESHILTVPICTHEAQQTVTLHFPMQPCGGQEILPYRVLLLLLNVMPMVSEIIGSPESVMVPFHNMGLSPALPHWP